MIYIAMSNKTILITGSAGQLGSFLVNYFKQEDVKKKLNIAYVTGIDKKDVDIENANDVQHAFQALKSMCDENIYVIHCAAATDTTSIEKEPFQYYATNCLGAKNIAMASKNIGAKLIYISTDYIFSEYSTLSNDRLQPFPVNQYGLQKLIAEQFVKEEYANSLTDLLIFRSSWMFGNTHKSFIEKFLINVFKTYANNEVDNTGHILVKVANDAYGKPTSVWYIADKIANAIESNQSGEINSHDEKEQINRFDWAYMIWQFFFHRSFKMINDVMKMHEIIKIVPVASNELDISINPVVKMHHPGLVNTPLNIAANTRYGSTDHKHINKYAFDTGKYIDEHIEQLVKLATQVLKYSTTDR